MDSKDSASRYQNNATKTQNCTSAHTINSIFYTHQHSPRSSTAVPHIQSFLNTITGAKTQTTKSNCCISTTCFSLLRLNIAFNEIFYLAVSTYLP